VSTSAKLAIAALGAFITSLAAGSAWAQPGSLGLVLAANDFTTSNSAPGPVTTGRTLEWDSRKGRWGLKLGMEQRTDRLSEWHDVQPGLYYRITPRFHIGGAVSLAPDPQINPRQVDPQPSAPRVRLETTFKF
jgi:hypothetical protein